MEENRYCKICGTELQEWEIDICQNCQDILITSTDFSGY